MLSVAGFSPATLKRAVSLTAEHLVSLISDRVFGDNENTGLTRFNY